MLTWGTSQRPPSGQAAAWLAEWEAGSGGDGRGRLKGCSLARDSPTEALPGWLPSQEMQLKPAAAPSAPTQASFLSLVYPSLIITYLGQTAMILKK